MATTSKFKAVEDRLAQYLRLTHGVLDTLIPKTEPRDHLWDLVPLYHRRGGKGFRPGLCIATCRAVGGDTTSVLLSAAALELLHNAFLVHDDIEDESEQRRGQPTLHAAHGVAIAVNVGDAMNVLSLRPLMDNLSLIGPALTHRVFQEVEHMVRNSVEGQAMELGWVRDNDFDLSDDSYLRMTLKKTCWYTCIHPCRIGAIIGSQGRCDPDAFNRFGYYMGAAFQIQDDILNLVGEEARYGKEIGGDIWEGKRTLMLIHAMNSTNARERERLRRFLARPRSHRKGTDVQWVYRVMKRYRCIDHARSCARQLAGAALREFQVAFGGLRDSPDKRMIEQIVLYMVERDL